MFKRAVVLTFVFTILCACIAFAGEKIDINKANADELASLTGVGDKYAERIVDYRENNGMFKNVEDLMKVKGIGVKTVEKNRDMIVVGKKD
jgi:competence protein ComEA